MKRREVLATLALAGCSKPAPALEGGWVGASHERGHRLRSGSLPVAAVQRRAHTLVVGAGIAGLSAARAFARAGVDDVQLLELEDVPGGNSRGHVLGGQACPLGAHYLPLPGDAAHEVSDWLHEIGLLRQELGRTVADERHLCHSPQERLFIDGAWAEGLLPPADSASTTQAQYRRFADAVAAVQKLGFAIPTARAPWTAAHAELDALTFARWLAREGFDDTKLRWYLDYCCRDDYGAGTEVVSAWAGLHYFASRHGFHAPGDETAEREPVFTWPEGNAWLMAKLAAPFADRLHTGRTVLRVEEQRHGVQLLVWNEASSAAESWTAERVVLALPLFVAARLLQNAPDALRQAAASQPHAPWLVANLLLDKPLLDRPGAPPSWDNVAYGSEGLGYVDAGHQRLSPAPGPVVLTAYRALPTAQRAALLNDDWATWAARMVSDLAPTHPDLPHKVRRMDLMRYGHAMAVPAPGQRGSAALAALRAQRGRIRFAHSDLAAYSVFEEAFTLGHARRRVVITLSQAAGSLGRMDEIIGLFPTPFLRAPGVLGRALVDGLVEHFSARAARDNNSSDKLSHTAMLKPGDSPLLVAAAALITPKLADFGALLFGERLGWSLKEMWVNVLDTGGRQAMHNHANSFVSGVVYLTPTHPDSQTVFMKSPGGTDFCFRNDHAGVVPTEYSADKWVSPKPAPGDMVLFPSYLMHAVPPNPGERRITLSFNAIPSRLDSWGYTLGFGG